MPVGVCSEPQDGHTRSTVLACGGGELTTLVADWSRICWVSRYRYNGRRATTISGATVCCGVQVWRIEKFELAEVPQEKHGQFTSGDCYVVLYSYGDPQRHLVYMWQGAEATVDERGGCAVCAVQVDEQHCGGSAPQVRAAPLPCGSRADTEIKNIQGYFLGLTERKLKVCGSTASASACPVKSCWVHVHHRASRRLLVLLFRSETQNTLLNIRNFSIYTGTVVASVSLDDSCP